jgi:hypothetical protein
VEPIEERLVQRDEALPVLELSQRFSFDRRDEIPLRRCDRPVPFMRSGSLVDSKFNDPRGVLVATQNAGHDLSGAWPHLMRRLDEPLVDYIAAVVRASDP